MTITVEEAARRIGIHPFEVVRHFAAHRQALPGFAFDEKLLPTLLTWAGLESWWDEAGPEDEKSAADAEENPRSDPDPRRRVVRWIPFKLLQKGKVGASHTRIDNAWRGLPGDLRGFGKAVVDAMKREGMLHGKPTVNGEHIYLDPERLEDIERLIAWRDPPALFLRLVRASEE